MHRNLSVILSFTTALLAISLFFFPSNIDTWPYFPAIYGAYLVFLLGLYYWYDADPSWVIALIAISAGIYRLALFSYPPSLIRMDPDAYAVQIARLLDGQPIDQIDFIYYRKAPLHLLIPIFLSLGAGISIIAAMSVYPVLVGVSIPLIVGVLARELAPSRIAGKVGVLAAAFAAVEVFSIRFAIAPIAQSTATVFWYLAVLLLIFYFRRRDRLWFVSFLVCIVAILFTHSLPIILLSGVLPAVAGVRYLYCKYVDPHQQNRSLAIALIGVVLFGIQSVFLTDFAFNISLKILTFINSAGDIGASGTSMPTAATPAISPELFLLGNFGPSVLLLAFGGVAWLYVLSQSELRSQPGIPTLLTIIAIVTVALAASILAPEIAQPIRIFLLLGGLLGILISLAFADAAKRTTLSRSRILKGATAMLVCLLIVTQPLSFMAAIAYPDGPRLYLTEDEIETKEWVSENIEGPVYTDYYYALEVIPSQFDDRAQSEKRTKAGAAAARQHQIKPLSSELTNGTIRNESHEYIIYRDIDVYRVQGGVYRLSWDYQGYLQTHYKQIYRNGDVVVYQRKT